MSSSTNPCRFGYECRRADCWFLHPNGRAIDQQALQTNLYGGHGVPMTMMQAMPQMSHAAMQPINAVPYSGGVTKPLTAHNGSDTSSGSSQRGGSSVCRYGRTCHRAECWFRHPEGRTIDEQQSNNVVGSDKASRASPGIDDYDDALDEFEGRDTFTALDEAEMAARAGDFDCPCCNNDPEHCTTPVCRANGVCACQADRITDPVDTTDGLAPSERVDDTWRDEWFPSSRECECCVGYVYRCNKRSEECASGTCQCRTVVAQAVGLAAAVSDAKPT